MFTLKTIENEIGIILLSLIVIMFFISAFSIWVCKKTTQNKITKIQSFFWSLLLIFSSLCILGFQFFHYLKYGLWEKVSILYFLKGNSIWADSPDNWIGLHNILEKIPLSLSLFVIGIGLIQIYDE